MAQMSSGRKKNITGQGASVGRRGSGTGMGHVGGGSYMGGGSGGSSGGGMHRSGGGGRGKLIMIIIVLFLVLGGGGGGLASLLGGGGGDTGSYGGSSSVSSGAATTASSLAGALTGSGSSALTGSGLSSLFGSGGVYGAVSSSSADWISGDNTGSLNRSVASEARAKYTTVKGNGEDTVTIMVYMCGTDLESRSGMATNDLQEMLNAKLEPQVNLIVYTGGCKQWKNNIVSSSVNQIYQIKDGKMLRLVEDDGTAAMTDPKNLTSFIRYCADNFPANRNMLIFWDHGGGSVSGYGYDEKKSSAGSMSLAGINTALSDAGLKYDFIGFDACLMATVETDLMAAQYADYMIASEETEPGVGWYYTGWLTELSQNPGMDTLDIGKKIVDDFVSTCARTCNGQKTTLSVVDLAELEGTLSDDFKAFSQSTTQLIKSGEYQTVSNARSGAREFAQSSKIDQIDLVNFAKSLGTKEGEALAGTLLSAVKYNRTSSNMTNAYGISVYFPYRKTSSVPKAIGTYDQIGLDSEYSDCIREFASLELSGQAATGGASLSGQAVNPLSILGGSSSSGSSLQSLESVLSLVSAFSGGGSVQSIFGGRALSDQETADFIAANQFDAGSLAWTADSAGNPILHLSEANWNLIHSIDLNMYIDDGEGYIDLGLDNLYEIDEAGGNLIPDTDGTWVSVNNQPVAYYHTDTAFAGDVMVSTGYVPAMLNGQRVKLIVIFEDGNGRIAGADPDYDPDSETDTVARGLIDIEKGDKIDFLCDYYAYDGTFVDSFYLGEQLTVGSALTVSDTYLSDAHIALYRFTDIYNQTYWSPQLP